MFEQPTGAPVPPSPKPAAASRPEPEDIFAGVEAAGAPAAPKAPVKPMPVTPPVVPMAKPVMPVRQSQPAMAAATTVPVSESGSRRWILITAGIVGLLVVAGAGWYVYSQIMSPAEPTVAEPIINDSVNTNQPITNEPAVVVPTDTDFGDTNQPATNQPIIVDAPPADSDFDGLSDEEEAKFGTNPQAADTDNDGLTDRQEVYNFPSDPLKADSDGDGFDDGTEVRSGYDPIGPGALLNTF